MVLTKHTTRTFHRVLYSGELQSITLLKRNDDQQEGTVRAIKLFQCRRSSLVKAGEPIQSDMSVGSRVVWHIPFTELKRVGVDHINVLDRVVDEENRYWQPEAGQAIQYKLFSNHCTFDCVRVDPPRSQ